MKKYSAWVLFVVVLIFSAWRLRGGQAIWWIALTPILAVATLGEIYDSFDKYEKTGIKTIWLKIPFATKVASLPRISENQKFIVAIFAFFFAMVVIGVAAQKL